ncbi:MAG: glycoside hydrolase family 3 C-terminal domain-containing protein [Bacilli bacterium]|nr:glycoside hydrolase family 3 C-terminal domain-containing protein [Bacilli bacterium]
MARKHQDIIDQLTLKEKASLVSGKDFWQTVNIDRVGIPSAFLSDGPHGVRRQAAAADHLGLNASIPATCYPTAATMANSWDPELGEGLGQRLGQEAAVQKVNVLLGPGMNMKRNPLCGRNFEYFSEDPYLAGKMAAGYVRGIQSNGISACVKHFACNDQEENRMTLDSVLDERTFREIYLTAFEIAVKEGKTKSIMSAYNLINGVYANENEHLLCDILRKEWGFGGLVVTDWGGNNDGVLSLKCGNQLEMPGTPDRPEEVIKAIENGELEESVLDDNLDVLLDTIFDTMENGVKKAPEKFDVEEHHAFAEKCAEESAVLLKNDGVLPLKKEEKVAFIGDFLYLPRYQGAGSSIVNPTKLDNTVDLLKNLELDIVGSARGFNRYGKKNKKLLKEALELAAKADTVVLYLGLDEVTEAEGLDRSNAKIENNQIELVKQVKALGKKIVVVLSCGSAVELPFVDDVDGLLHCYLNGQAGAQATLNILEGKVNPSGKLSETYPIVYEDVASSDNFPSHTRTIEYREAYGIGYRYFEKANVETRFPFGFGLSYTKFEYSNIKISDKGVNFEIKNVGDVDGKEIAQLYVGLKNSVVIRPVKELKGFIKVFLKAGESKRVEIPFDDKTFRYFNTKTNKWEIEKGIYDIYVGAAVNDIRLSGYFEQEGTGAEAPYNIDELPNYASGRLRNVPDEEFAKLLGHEIPNGALPFYKKNRMVIDYNTTFSELRYSKRWIGRLVGKAIPWFTRVLRKMGNRVLANTLVMGVVHQPMRGMSRFSGGGLRMSQLDGLIMIFNGHFWKGLHHFNKEGRKYKKIAKAEKKAQKEAEAAQNK